MRPRHKTPQTFSLWMVDVLCCSLGSVIILWLHYSNETATKSDLVLRLEADIDSLQKKLKAGEIKVADLDKRLLSEIEKKAALEQLLQKRVGELTALSELLDALKKEKADLTTESAGRQKRVDELLKQLAKITENSDALQRKLDALAKLNDSLKDEVKTKTTAGAAKQKRIDELLAQLNKLAESSKGVEALLEKRVKEIEELEKRLGTLSKRNVSLEDELKASTMQGTTKQRRIDELLKLADDLTKKLANAEDAVKQLERTAKLLPKLEEELKDYRIKLTDEEARRKLLQGDLAKRLEEIAKQSKDFETLLLAKKALEKKMEGMSKDLVKLLAENEKAGQSDGKIKEMKDLLGRKDQDLKDAIAMLERMRGDADRLKELMDRRFAGVALTGRNVVFLVDTSGSMDLVDENTPSLDKWPGVRDTLAKVMTSMPNLKKFQVVTFAEEIAYPVGKASEWIDFDPKKSAEQVREALTRIKPSGGTNLYKAFQAAFRMRPHGLDTVYIFSDGLPSDGDGLTAEQDRATLRDPTARALLLTRHLRKKLKDDWNGPLPGQERVRINSIGFFYESPDVGAFLWALSREHDGSFVGMSKP